MAEQEKCPDCGALTQYLHLTSSGHRRHVYACGRDDGGPVNVPCLERQLTAKDVEIKRLADLLGDALAHTHRSYREPILAVLRERAGRPKAAEAIQEQSNGE